MRQAGRTLPEYRELRERHSFWEICRSPELAAEVTLQPLRRFPLDAAIIFSDILVIPAAMGLQVEIFPKMSLAPPVQDLAAVERLKIPDPARDLGYVAEALRRVRRELGGGKALLGFAGAPFTLACYMVEGGGSKHYSRTKAMMFREENTFQRLMEKLSAAVGDFLEMQMESGADAVQLFDTWAGELSPGDYRRLVVPHVSGIVSRLKGRGIPVIYYANNVGSLLEHAASIRPDVLGIDWRQEISGAVHRLGPDRPALQGNLDPCALFAPPEEIRSRVRQMLQPTRGRGHIANLGHGILPETPLEGVEAFLEAVHSREVAGGRG